MKDISLLGHPIITMHKVCFLNEKIQDHLLKKKLDLSLSQYMVLVFLSLKPGQSQEDLAVRRNSTEASDTSASASTAPHTYSSSDTSADLSSDAPFTFTSTSTPTWRSDCRLRHDSRSCHGMSTERWICAESQDI